MATHNNQNVNVTFTLSIIEKSLQLYNTFSGFFLKNIYSYIGNEEEPYSQFNPIRTFQAIIN